jgi:hypothetical protein
MSTRRVIARLIEATVGIGEVVRKTFIGIIKTFLIV